MKSSHRRPGRGCGYRAGELFRRALPLTRPLTSIARFVAVRQTEHDTGTIARPSLVLARSTCRYSSPGRHSATGPELPARLFIPSIGFAALSLWLALCVAPSAPPGTD